MIRIPVLRGIVSCLALALLAASPTLATPIYSITDLGTLGGRQSMAYGINDSGQVVGDSWLPGESADHAFLWDSADGMVDLNPYVSGSGWTLTSATAINDLGHIVGWGTNPAGKTHAFLLTPEPSSVALMGIGLAALALRRRRKAG